MNVTMIPATKKVSTDTIDKYHQLRVAAYCRVSTEQEEQQNSYQVQIDYYTDLINKNKEWELAGIFADEGISGTQTKKRTEFNKMIRLCKKRKIDLVLCKSISRFARNTVDTLEYVRQLKDLGIGVIFEKENINTLTMTSEFMIALYGSFAQAESESISKNVSWGVEKAFRDGKIRYSYNNLYGYRKGADGKPEIIPEEAEVVRLIYKLYLDGLTLRQIAQHLNALKIPKREYTKWNINGIHSILSNEKYVGDALLQKTYIHHLFPKNYLTQNGIPQAMYNQIANYVFLQQEINIKISDDSPAEYMKEVYGQIDTKVPVYGAITDIDELKENLRQNCVPEGFESMTIEDYSQFLEKRRVLMARKIKEYYFSL